MIRKRWLVAGTMVVISGGFLLATPRVQAAPVVSYEVARFPPFVYGAGWTWSDLGKGVAQGAVGGIVGTLVATGFGPQNIVATVAGAVAGAATYAAGQAVDALTSALSSSTNSDSTNSSDSSSSSSDSNSNSDGGEGMGPGDESDNGFPPGITQIRDYIDCFSSGGDFVVGPASLSTSDLVDEAGNGDQYLAAGGFDGIARIYPPTLEGILGLRLWQLGSLTRVGGKNFTTPTSRTSVNNIVDVRLNFGLSLVNGVPDRNILLD